MIYILLGLPGAGKGTQGDLLASRLGIPRISTGDILRDAVRRGTPLGKKAKEAMDRGELVSDEIVIGIVEEKLKSPDCAKGCILDGFPRNLNQAKALEELSLPLKVIYIDVPEQEVIKRLSSRRVCPKCGAVYNLITSPPKKEGICDRCGSPLVQREDDREEVIRERIRVYRQQTEPIVEFYNRKGALVKVDGMGGVEEVFQKVLEAI